MLKEAAIEGDEDAINILKSLQEAVNEAANNGDKEAIETLKFIQEEMP